MPVKCHWNSTPMTYFIKILCQNMLSFTYYDHARTPVTGTPSISGWCQWHELDGTKTTDYLKYQPFSLLSYSSMIVCLKWLYRHMLSVPYISRESGVLCLLLMSSLMMCANIRIYYGPTVVSVCLHITLTRYHHYADLSEGIQLLKCLSLTFCLGCVSKIYSILSIIFHPIYGALCIQLTHFSYDGCENMCNLSCHHHQSEV